MWVLAIFEVRMEKVLGLAVCILWIAWTLAACVLGMMWAPAECVLWTLAARLLWMEVEM